MGWIVDLWWLWAVIFSFVAWIFLSAYWTAKLEQVEGAVVKNTIGRAMLVAALLLVGLWAFVLLLMACLFMLRYGGSGASLPWIAGV